MTCGTATDVSCLHTDRDCRTWAVLDAVLDDLKSHLLVHNARQTPSTACCPTTDEHVGRASRVPSRARP